MKIVISVCLVFLLSSVAQAQLKWEKRTIDVKTKPEDVEARGEFNFVNAGDHPIHITRVTTSCGCTKAETDKTVYAPGEKGVVSAAVDLAGHTGKISKYVTLITDEKDPEIKVIINAEIPQLLEMTPGRIVWSKQSNNLKPVTVNLKVTKDVPLHLNQVIDAPPYVKAELRTIKDGEEYEMLVTPINPGMPFSYTLRVQTDIKTKNGLKEVDYPVTVQ